MNEHDCLVCADEERRNNDPNYKFPRPACVCSLATHEEPPSYIWDDDISRWVCPGCGDIQ